MFRVEVADFGPIIKGAVDVKPLTVFIGPNSSGKSYLAMLVYALLRAFRQRPYLPYAYQRFSGRHFRIPFGFGFLADTLRRDKQVKQSWEKWLQNQAPSETDFQVLVSSLPENVQDLLHKTVEHLITSSADMLTSEMKRCYRAAISELVRKENPAAGLSVSLRQEKSGLAVSFSSINDKVRVASHQFQLPEGPLPIRGRLRGRPERLQLLALPPEILLDAIGNSIRRGVFQDLLSDIYYLPAARSGILQNHRALTSLYMERSPLIGIEQPPDIPQFTGVVADFISLLLRVQQGEQTKLKKMADQLEKEAIRGRIVLGEEKHLYPEIFYEDEREGKFPLHRTSSGVSEVAPIVLFLRYVVEPGDFLIIEEPEAHLHPEAQRKLARVLVRLVRADTKVLITTHSDYLVQQLGNFVSLSQIRAGARAKKGYGKEDYVLPEEVGAYLFRMDETKAGSFIEELKVDNEGIDEDEFGKVAGALYDETVYLHRKLSA